MKCEYNIIMECNYYGNEEMTYYYYYFFIMCAGTCWILQ